MQFADFFLQLEYLGLSDVLLPFILIFTIIFAVLQKSKILGTESDGKTPKKNFNVVLALVMGMSIIIPHVTGRYIDMIGFDPVDALNQSLPQVSIVVVAIILALLLIGVFGVEVPWGQNRASSWIVIIAFILVLLIFGSATGWFLLPDFMSFLLDPEVSSLVIMILVFGLIIWFITKPEKTAEERTAEKAKYPNGKNWDFFMNRIPPK